MNRQNGFTILELIVVIVISLIVVELIVGSIFNNPSSTEFRANENFDNFVQSFNLVEGDRILRKSCSHDSDKDGLSSCSVAIKYNTGETEKIYAQCPAGIVSHVFGATGCKETNPPTKIGVGVNTNTSSFLTR